MVKNIGMNTKLRAEAKYGFELLAIEMKKLSVKVNKPVHSGFSILEISKTLYVILNRNIKTMQNYVTWILTALLFILKLKIFIKTLQMMLKNGLTPQTIVKMMIDHFQTSKRYEQESN